MKYYKHQKELITKNPTHHLLSWECGTGKTLTSIVLTENNSSKVLIVCPKSLKVNWKREIKKWSNNDVEFNVVSKEEHKRDWEKLLQQEYTGLIIDECHYYGGYRSQMYKTMLKYIKKSDLKCLYLLTATPYMSTPFNIMCYETLLGKETNYIDYRRRFFTDIRMGNRVVPVIKVGIEDDIAMIVKSLGSTIRIQDCKDMPDKVYLREDFELTSDQKKAEKMLEDNPLISNHIVYWTAKHRICGGTYNDDGEIKKIKSQKLNRIKEYMKRYKKFIVVCRYNSELRMLKEIIGDRADILNGETENRQGLIDKMDKSNDGIFLIQSSMCEGYNLVGYNMMIFYSNGFSLKDRIQMEGRIYRIGQENKCVYIDYVIKGGIDEDVMQCLRNKKQFDISIYGAN